MRHRGADNIAHAWAHGHDRPKGLSNCSVLYESGSDTIYSYGRHFPMAKHYGGKVLLTLQSYSSTTAGHLSAVRSAISHMDVVRCYIIPGADRFMAVDAAKDTAAHEKNIQHWITNIKVNLQHLATARKKSIYLDDIARVKAEAQKYIDLFKLKLNKADHKLLFESDLGDFEKLAKKEAAARIAKQKADFKRGAELHEKWLPLWRDHKLFNAFTPGEEALIRNHQRMLLDGNAVWLRVTKWDDGRTTLHTSKGIELPVDVAHRYYKIYLSKVAAGGCNANCDTKFLDYSVKEMTAEHLLVGCHDIARSEIDYIANKLNW